jgi:soluble lytic murein transglycosylase
MIPPRTLPLLSLALCLLPPVCSQSLDQLTRAHRDKPSTSSRSALLKFAAAHPKDTGGALALLSVGVTEVEQQNWEEGLRLLKATRSRLPQLFDYMAYFIAAAHSGREDYAEALRELEPLHNGKAFPLAGRAALLGARALIESGAPQDAVTWLKLQYGRLLQPDGDLLLAQALEAAGDYASAAVYYQLIYYKLPGSRQAEEAGSALVRLRESLGPAFPPPMPKIMMERADKWLDAREWLRARREYQDLLSLLAGPEQELARVRLGAVDFHKRDEKKARAYLENLSVASPEADAERLYYLAACGRRLDDDGSMAAAVDRLGRLYPSSPWRLRALVEAGNYYLLRNDGDSYEPFYRSCFESFPSDAWAPYCHWKVAWFAYLSRKPDAAALLEEHLRRFPTSSDAPGALYFLGRLREQAGDPGAALAYYARIGSGFPNHYYALLAAERAARKPLSETVASTEVTKALNGLVSPNRRIPEGFQPSADTRRRIERARLLFSAGLSGWAETELRFEARDDPQAHVLAMELAEAAARRGAHDQAIRHIKAVFPEYLSIPLEALPERFWRLAFPWPYRKEIEKHAKANSVNPYLMAGLIRQESEFDPRAVSRANARGLTQIVPATGRQLTRRLRLGRFRTSRLFRPDLNIRLGAYYFRGMLEDFGGKLEPALASYNGGKTRVENWLTWAEYNEPAEFIETIPLSETRNYVKTVLRQSAIYRRLYAKQ